MVSSTNSSTNNVLNTYFTNLINTVIQSEKKQYVTPLEEEKDLIDIKKSIFSDLKTKFTDLQSQVSRLFGTSADSLFSDGRKVSTSGAPSGSTIMTATATDKSVPGTWKVEDITLAKTHRVSSDRMSSSDKALNASGSITLNGKTISIADSDTLYSIASKINTTTFDTNKGVTASVVDQRLVLESKTTGEANAMTIEGSLSGTSLGLFTGTSFKNVLQEAADASFTVNGMTVSRTYNTNINDVISGVTLNLTADAEKVGVDSGNSLLVTVEKDVDSVKSTLNSFVSSYNALQTYLQQKTTSTKISDTQYERGALSDDLTYRSVRGEMADLLGSDISSTGDPSFINLNQIGISINDDLTISLDSSKLSEVLSNDLAGVKELLQKKMTNIDSMISQFTGAKGNVTQTMTSLDERYQDLNTRISSANSRLEKRKTLLTEQYSAMQEQITALQYNYNTLYSLGLFNQNTE